MTSARANTVVEEEACYHCVSRCVRRAFLHGQDFYSGKNYDHRKGWIRERLIFLTQVFTIEALAAGLMSNHAHTLLRTRPDLLSQLSDKDVLQRWIRLYPLKGPEPLIAEQFERLLTDSKKINTLRKRLCSVSWFMKSLNEFIARRANKEDDCKGRFWEGRFKCQRVCGEAALLCCAVYIDLNPIRANQATSPEDSTYTSAFERIEPIKGRPRTDTEADLWLAPIKRTSTRRGFLSISVYEYLEILDATGREFKNGKKGRIPQHLAPILTRLGIKPDKWSVATTDIAHNFSTIFGPSQFIRDTASKLGKKWLKGIGRARLAFA